MGELSFTSNQVDLSDYDITEDVERRRALAHLDQTEFEVLEEILYSPSHFPVKRLTTNLSLTEKEITPVLDKLMKSKLFSKKDEEIVVNKDMRKNYEDEIDRFEEVPGIEALKTLLKRVPIHVLPNWYPIPRCSDNIFDSIVEKFLQTPQKFQRYLLELNFSNPQISCIIQDVMNSPEYKVSSKEIMSKYDLSHQQFEEIMIYLELNFVCCLAHEREGDQWHEVVTFFKEWRDYLLFIKNNKPKPICDLSQIRRTRPSEFAFVEDMGTLVNIAAKDGLKVQDGLIYSVDGATGEKLAKRFGHFNLANPELFRGYLNRVIEKAITIELVKLVDEELQVTADGKEWLGMHTDKRALELHRHPLNKLASKDYSQELLTERNIRAVEKSLESVADSGWIYFDDFLKGAMVALDDEKNVTLERKGRSWKYNLPTYSDDESSFIKSVIMDWLFECCVVTTGTVDGRPCFSVTSFGQSFYD